MNLHNLEKVSDNIVPPTIPPQNLCKQCGTILSCGCQRLLASDGTEVCDECITSYEDRLNSVK